MLENVKKFNFIVAADSYKVSHKAQYPADTKFLYSVIVPRRGNGMTDEIVSMGINYLSACLANTKITREMIDEAEVEITEQGYFFDRKPWEMIADKMYGNLPLMICGVPEGLVVKPQTPLMAVMNTIDGFGWLASYVETFAQRVLWKMSTVATISRYCRKEIEHFMKDTGADMSMLDYKLHNFGDRGADGYDAAIMAGIAHASVFSGSDCMAANRYIKEIYETDKPYLSSVDATEHSVMCSWSDAENKDDFGAAVMAVERLEAVVERTKRGIGIPLMSVVIDTYDSHRFVDEYLGKRLKQRILDSGGVLVARPDSDDPTVEPIEIVKLLDKNFGSTVNERGYKVLHPSVRVIQGDGINMRSITDIMSELKAAGYSMDNLTFGMGGGLTHEAGRDEFSFSQKATARYDGEKWVSLLKEPKTDSGKKSLSGCVFVKSDDNGNPVVTSEQRTAAQRLNKYWKLYYNNGQREMVDTFDEVRARARV